MVNYSVVRNFSLKDEEICRPAKGKIAAMKPSHRKNFGADTFHILEFLKIETITTHAASLSRAARAFSTTDRGTVTEIDRARKDRLLP
jgi:hypothetical protein